MAIANAPVVRPAAIFFKSGGSPLKSLPQYKSLTYRVKYILKLMKPVRKGLF
jgi:hypothetical protein